MLLVVYYCLRLGSFGVRFEACQGRLLDLGDPICGESIVLSVQILVQVVLISYSRAQLLILHRCVHGRERIAHVAVRLLLQTSH